ncbi:ABC transporter permease [Thiobacter aerophilum]|uniref:ABC transporter permease subunit n=1 Tax=Thiobacter aerophilum TaxID=3121275 RepID=A0ABV0EHJ0_9BURK
MILTLARKELKILFASPLAWVVLAVLQLVFAWVFLFQLDQYLENLPRLRQLANPPGVTEVVVAMLFGFAAIVLLMAVPLMSMRLFADEYRNQTLPLLFAAPVSLTEIVLGKFCGLMLFLSLAVLLLVAMAMSLALGGPLDWGLLAANVLGIVLLLAAFSALSLFLSSLTQHGVVAAFSSFGALLLLWLINASDSDPEALLNYLSLMRHFDGLNRGLLDTRDVAYLLIFTALFLTLTIRRLDARRLTG